jgi:hypothetical protein
VEAGRAPLRPGDASDTILAMAIWILIALVAFVKLPIAAVMIWAPFRNDRDAIDDPGDEPARVDDPAPDDGPPGEGPPRRPAPRPRRGPHGELPLPAPPRVRAPARMPAQSPAER